MRKYQVFNAVKMWIFLFVFFGKIVVTSIPCAFFLESGTLSTNALHTNSCIRKFLHEIDSSQRNLSCHYANQTDTNSWVLLRHWISAFHVILFTTDCNLEKVFFKNNDFKTCVSSMIHSPAGSDHYSRLNFVLFCDILNSGRKDGRAEGRSYRQHVWK